MINYTLFICLYFSLTSNNLNPDIDFPVLHKKIIIPSELWTNSHGLDYGGDIRMGDLKNDKTASYLVYRAANSAEGGACQPVFLGAFDNEMKILWTKGNGGLQPNRPGPVAIHDIDVDGKSEVICLFAENPDLVDAFSMENISVMILDGKTGEVRQKAIPSELTSAKGKGPNWVHQRILICNLRGTKSPQDFIIKLGTRIVAFNHKLDVLWTYENTWSEYQNCPAYIPTVGDMDNDGKDEIFGGYYVLNPDGSPVWEKKLGKNMDSVTIDYWDNKKEKRAIGSGYGYVLDKKGNKILMLGKEIVPHGQELRVADFDKTSPGREMIIRYAGHFEQVMLVGNKGNILRKFKLNPSPNNTGMEAVFWKGEDQEALLYNGGMLWKADGSKSYYLPELPEEQGNKRQGWYHCIPANVANDEREEIIIYNPWSYEIFIYTQKSDMKEEYQGYIPAPRQYNVRLMD